MTQEELEYKKAEFSALRDLLNNVKEIEQDIDKYKRGLRRVRELDSICTVELGTLFGIKVIIDSIDSSCWRRIQAILMRYLEQKIIECEDRFRMI